MFHAANAGHLAGTRIENDEGTLVFVDGHAGRRDDPRQAIVDGPFQLPSVNQQLRLEIQHIRRLAGVLLEEVVAALAKHIDKQGGTLKRVDAVLRHWVGWKERLT